VHSGTIDAKSSVPIGLWNFHSPEFSLLETFSCDHTFFEVDGA